MTGNNYDASSFDDVMSLARRWYYTEIRSLADEAIRAVHADKPSSSYDENDRREFLTGWVDETTDAHSFVIYTAKAGMVLAASDCDSAYEDATGETGASVEVRACFAMRADVWALLEARSDEWSGEADVWPDEDEVDAGA